MKQEIHPQWFPEAVVNCACGNSWTTGATVPSIHTDVCSECHPFYTGEQRIMDVEGRVDKFVERLQKRDRMRAEAAEREAAKTPPDLPLAELGLGKRYLNVLEEHGITVVQDVLNKLAEGESAFLELPSVGRKMLADMKKALRSRGYELPTEEDNEEPEAEDAE